VDVAINGSLGCSNHEIMEFRILWGSDEGKYQATDPGFQARLSYSEKW